MLNSLLHIEKTFTGTNLNGSFATILMNHLADNQMTITKIVNVGRFDAELTIQYKNKLVIIKSYSNKSARQISDYVKKKIDK